MSAYEGWAIVELMGHRRLGGRVGEAEAYGAKLLRLDVPKTGTSDEWIATQFYVPARTQNGPRHVLSGRLVPPDSRHARRAARVRPAAGAPHYDLTKGRRERALDLGAVFVPALQQARQRRARQQEARTQ